MIGRRLAGVPVVVAVAFAGWGAGCYHAAPLDTRAMLGELRQSDPLPAKGAAPPAGAADGPLSEERSIALALRWNPDLRAFRHSRGIAEGELATASELSNPVLRFDLTHLQQGVGNLGWDLRLSWAPPQPGVRAGRRGAAAARIEETDHEISEREWSLACDVRDAHADVLALDEQALVTEDTVKNRRKLSTVVGRRVTQGAATRFDLDLVQLSLAAAEQTDGERRLARAVAVTRLVQLLGVGPPDGRAVAVTGALPDEEPGAPLPRQVDLEEDAEVHRPALAAARARYQASEQTLRAETAARLPWFQLSAMPRVRRHEYARSATDFAVGVDITLPILNTNEGRVRSATAARNVARGEAMSILAGIRADIARALATIETQRLLLQRLHAQVQPLLVEHDRLLGMAAQAAELDLPALIAAEDLVLATRTELIGARVALRKAQTALERAVGGHATTARRK